MSLRRALAALPDDRESAIAAREVIAFLAEHPNESVAADRVSRATGVDVVRVRRLLGVFAETFVVDCLGDSPDCSYRLASSPVLALEVSRFLRSNVGGDARLQKGTEKFRGRYGTNR